MSMLSSPESENVLEGRSDFCSSSRPKIGADSFGRFLDRMSITGVDSTNDSDFTSVKHHRFRTNGFRVLRNTVKVPE